MFGQVGLDIQTRKKIWEYIKKIHDEFDMSIFLTTHYMEEADNLCDRIGIIDHGKIQVMDSPQNMKSAMGSEVISMSLEKDSDEFLTEIKKIPQVAKINNDANKLILFVSNGADVMPKIFQIFSQMNIKINSVSLTQPTLDDVFISYTGHEIRDDHTS